jgi:S1-C subfamily serine protease
MLKQVFAGLVLLGLTLFSTGAKVWGQPASEQATRTSPKAFVGIGVEATPDNAKHQGVLIRSVAQDSPAAKAGIKEGDIVDKVEGKDVKDFDGLLSLLTKHRPGEQVSFHIVRDGQERTVNVTLGQRPLRRPGEGTGERASGFLGVLTQPLTPQAKERLNLTADKGVVVTEVLPDSPAAKSGLQRDDVIVSFAGQPIATARELRDAVQATGAGKEARLSVLRGQQKMDVNVRLDEFPVAGLAPITGAFPALEAVERAPVLERRIQDLEKRVRDLEQNRTVPPK